MVLAGVLVLALLPACSFRNPNASPHGDRAAVGLRNLQISDAGGHRAVLLRLTRVPSALRYSDASGPGRIIVEAYGPPGEGDFAEKTLPQDDPYVRQVRVSRDQGTLRITLDLHSEQPPPHQVHEMADWVMIRFGEPRS